MHHASLAHRRSSSPGSRVWSHNTGYTGAAGIHSEIDSGTHARIQRMKKQTSSRLTTEEELMKKEMKALKANRKSMETSMLQYSQKMRDISERKSFSRKSPVPFHTTKPNSSDKKQGRVPANTTLLPSLQGSAIDKERYSESESSKTDYSVSSYDTAQTQTSNRKQESRMSIDSGISLDSHRESVKMPQDLDMIEEDNLTLNTSVMAKLNSGNETTKEDFQKDDSKERGRPRERKRFRDSKTSKFAPLVDKETINVEENEDTNTAEEDIETPRIAPFPEGIVDGDTTISPWVLDSILENEEDNRVLDPMHKKNSRGGRSPSKLKSRTPYVLFKPKPAMSPSLAALRYRFFRRFRSNSVYFRYSEEVLAALRSLSNSPERRKSSKSQQSISPPARPGARSVSPSKKAQLFSFSPPTSPTLHGIDLEELLLAHSKRAGGIARLLMEDDEAEEFFVTKDLSRFPQLSRERSFSAPSSKGTQRSFVSKLEQVKENDDAKLKPVLKKDEGQFSNEKKNVQFFLPDIFMNANVCTSQPQEFR